MKTLSTLTIDDNTLYSVYGNGYSAWICGDSPEIIFRARLDSNEQDLDTLNEVRLQGGKIIGRELKKQV